LSGSDNLYINRYKPRHYSNARIKSQHLDAFVAGAAAPEDAAVMTLAIVLGASWLVIVTGVVAMFRVAARGDEVLPPTGSPVGGAGEHPPAHRGAAGAEAPALRGAPVVTREWDVAGRTLSRAAGGLLGGRAGPGASLRHFS
jgi:hypothetical protein